MSFENQFVENYLGSVTKQFQYYKLLAEQTFEQLNEEELFESYNKESNAIAIIVNHLSGNMKSRWTKFLTTDGEKSWREREREFESVILGKEEMLMRWEEGWTCLFEGVDSLSYDNISQPIYIRNQEHTIIEAINRQLAHYSYHVGQIVYIGRMCKGKEWKSLSIPKGASALFNEEKFSVEKHREHFTD
jgi:hypothetical protein